MGKATKQSEPVTDTKDKTQSSRKKKYFDVSFYHDWCKSCGICMAFCPQEIIGTDSKGRPVIEDADRCVGCRFCEIHCPDFAITVSDRKPKRRINDV